MSEPPSWYAPSGPPPDVPPPAYGPGYGSGYGFGAGYGYPGQQQPFAPDVAKPGVIPLRPLAVSEILDGAFTTIRWHPKATLGLSAAVACVQQALTLGWRAQSGTLSSSGALFDASSSQVTRFVGGIVVTSLISAVLGAILTAALCLIVSDSVLGHPTSAGAAWRRLRPQVWRVIGGSLLLNLILLLGWALCLLPGLFLWGALGLTMPALVLEGNTITGALRRSWQLAMPGFGRVLGIRVLGYLVRLAVAAPIAAVVSSTYLPRLVTQMGNGDPHVGTISTTTILVTTLAAVIVTTVTAPFQAGLVTLLYVDQRIRTEALDVTLQQAAVQQTVQQAGGGPVQQAGGGPAQPGLSPLL